MGLGEGTRALEELGRLDALAEQLSQSYPGARLDDIDLDALGRGSWATRPGPTSGSWPTWSASCASGASFDRAEDGSLRLSPKASAPAGRVRAASDVADQISGRRGERETRRSGAAGEPTGSTRAVGVRRHPGLERAAHAAQRPAAAGRR